MSTKYVQTVTSNNRSTITNVTRDFDADNSIAKNDATGTNNDSIADDYVEDNEDSTPVDQEKT